MFQAYKLIPSQRVPSKTSLELGSLEVCTLLGWSSILAFPDQENVSIRGREVRRKNPSNFPPWIFVASNVSKVMFQPLGRFCLISHVARNVPGHLVPIGTGEKSQLDHNLLETCYYLSSPINKYISRKKSVSYAEKLSKFEVRTVVQFDFFKVDAVIKCTVVCNSIPNVCFLAHH